MSGVWPQGDRCVLLVRDGGGGAARRSNTRVKRWQQTNETGAGADVCEADCNHFYSRSPMAISVDEGILQVTAQKSFIAFLGGWSKPDCAEKC